MDRALLKPAEVAQILGIGRSKVYELLACGELPSIRIGRCIRVPKSSLEDWIKARIISHELLSISEMGHFLNRTHWYNQAASTSSLRPWL